MKRADVNWGEVRRKYESGMYTYQRLAREYHVCTQTVWRHAVKGQWQIGREEAEKQILRRCLMATAKLLETAAAGATERLESGEGSLKEVKELGGILQALVGTAAKMCQSEKNNDTAVNEIRVIMSEEVEAVERMISMPDLFIFAQAFPGILVGFVNFPAGCIVVKLTIRKFSLRRKG